jgi:hypothetical protein
MVVEGIVYVGGERAADGTLVEATIDDETVASFDTDTSGGQQGYFVIVIDGEGGDEITLLVDGEAAQILVEGQTEAVLDYEPGYRVADLVVGSSPPTVTLTIAVDGNGQTVPEAGEHTYPDGAEVRIGAVPDAGWEFDGWVGDVADPESMATQVVLDGDQTVTARFAPLPVSTPTPGPTSAPTDTSEPAATDTPTSEPSPTSTPEPSPTVAEGTDTATAEPSPTPGQAAGSATTGPSPTPGEAPASSPTPGEAPASSPTSAADGGTTPPSASSTPGEAPASTPASAAAGDATPGSSPTPDAAEEQGSQGLSGLLVAAVALAVLGLVAVGFGIYGLRRLT